MELIPLREDGTPAMTINLPDAARAVVNQTAAHYQRAGYAPPWIGYLAMENDTVVGTCAFVTAPADGEVEIAYYTLPGGEGRGVATRMAVQLIEIAARTDLTVIVKAHTLPEENASARVLRKLGFSFSESMTHPEDGEIWVWRLSHP